LENLAKLLAQPFLHFVFRWENAILGQPAGFDVSIEQDNMDPMRGQLFGCEQAGRPCSDHGD
jgi:hypothetical protein